MIGLRTITTMNTIITSKNNSDILFRNRRQSNRRNFGFSEDFDNDRKLSLVNDPKDFCEPSEELSLSQLISMSLYKYNDMTKKASQSN